MKKPNILILGKSGWGKSSSMRNLDPSTTAVINTERKILPFQNKFTHYQETNNNQSFMGAWFKFTGDTNIKVVIIDSFSARQQQIKTLCSEAWKGYDIWTNHNKMIREDMDRTKEIDGKYIVWIGLDEVITVDTPGGGTQSLRSVKVDGKEWKEAVENQFVVTLFVDVRLIEGKAKYRFMTNTDGTNPAKSPIGLFKEQFIDNDLKFVIDTCENFKW